MTTTADNPGAGLPHHVLAVGDEVLVRAEVVEDWGSSLKVRVICGPGFRVAMWVPREAIRSRLRD